MPTDMSQNGPETPEVLATLRASQSRRVMGVFALAALGVLLIKTAFGQQLGFSFQAILAIVGMVALWCAVITWRSTGSAVELTAQGLRDADGTVIARVEDITTVDRGVFAFKPSNGFTLRLRKADTTYWRFGLWWRLGRRIGIGGMTPAHHAKLMSERLAELINTAP